MELYKSVKEKLEAKKKESPDQAGGDKVKKLYDLTQCLRELLSSVQTLKEEMAKGTMKDFVDIQEELHNILRTIVEKVTKMSELFGKLDGLGLLEEDSDGTGVGVDSLDDIQDDFLKALIDAVMRAIAGMIYLTEM